MLILILQATLLEKLLLESRLVLSLFFFSTNRKGCITVHGIGNLSEALSCRFPEGDVSLMCGCGKRSCWNDLCGMLGTFQKIMAYGRGCSGVASRSPLQDRAVDHPGAFPSLGLRTNVSAGVFLLNQGYTLEAASTPHLPVGRTEAWPMLKGM